MVARSRAAAKVGGGGETQELTASNGERESREQRTENRERGTRT